jgi:tRNA isopentenyl-2-thiomethyl-A-37 hydroxylase MiaE
MEESATTVLNVNSKTWGGWMMTELDRRLADLRTHLDAELERLRARLKQTSRAHFERNVNILKRQLADSETSARRIFERGMASAAAVENPVLKKAYEESLKKCLEITLAFHKQVLDDFIRRWVKRFR